MPVLVVLGGLAVVAAGVLVLGGAVLLSGSDEGGASPPPQPQAPPQTTPRQNAPASPVAPRVPSVQIVQAQLRIRVPAARVAVARTVAALFRAAGHTDGLILAALTNAYAESSWNPKAHSPPPEDSVGFFQLNSAKKAAGEGMTTAEREDPVKNTRRILEVIAGPDGSALRAAQAQRRTVSELTEIFARDIERCAACGHKDGSSELVKRRAMAADLFGPAAAGAVVDMVRVPPELA